MRFKVEEWRKGSELLRIVSQSDVVGWLEPSGLGSKWIAWMNDFPIFKTSKGFVKQKYFRGKGEAIRTIESIE